MAYNKNAAMAEETSETHSSLFQRVGRLRWQAAFLALSLVLVHQWIEHAYLFFLPRWTHFLTQVVFYGLVGPILAWLALTSLRDQIGETEQAEREARRSRDELARTNRRLEFLIEVERRLALAEDEDELIDALLKLPEKALEVGGVSLMLNDERGDPLPARHHGQLPPEEFKRWAPHLAGGQSGAQCQSCGAQRANLDVPCPTLAQDETTALTNKIFSINLSRGKQDFGTLDLHLADPSNLKLDEQGMLQIMAASMSLALESQQLRTKELSTLHQLREIKQSQDLESQLHTVLRSTLAGLEVDGGALYLAEADTLSTAALIPEEVGPPTKLLTSLASAGQHLESPILAGDLEGGAPNQGSQYSILIAPLRRDSGYFGSLLLWSQEINDFSPRQIRIIESVASQVTLLIENHQLYSQVEFRASLAERARLAREIHDGLSQTLGYLKLRLIQALRWQDEGKTQAVTDSLNDIKQQLEEAYVDAREAIDGLRMDPGESSFKSWLSDYYKEFEQFSHIEIIPSSAPGIDLSPVAKSQLLRIIQEALGNIRKHAAASKAWIDWHQDDHWLVLRVRDNGRGFDIEDVPVISRHGLRIMRERAELLGADFQLSSRPGEGTQIEVRLPLSSIDREVQHDR